MAKLNSDELIQMIQDSGAVSLSDLKKLSLKDLEKVLDALRFWCVYSDGDKKKIKKNK
ncbi:MAG: hypothetical protein Q7U84_10115 [Polynucleobacter sp.]|jgi:hypothetical protein|nr:hypothetical protein [Polynucleobacter sp.]